MAKQYDVIVVGAGRYLLCRLACQERSQGSAAGQER